MNCPEKILYVHVATYLDEYFRKKSFIATCKDELWRDFSHYI